jgi:NAD(P)-dependent dehydrogenase (short-subunit alcohol dehydrogenase family)
MIFMDLGLNGKRALIMDASGELGGAIAQVPAGEGARVITAARSVDKRAGHPARRGPLPLLRRASRSGRHRLGRGCY